MLSENQFTFGYRASTAGLYTIISFKLAWTAVRVFCKVTFDSKPE